MYDIFFVSSYSKVTEWARQLAEELGLDITVIESALEEAVEAVKVRINNPQETILISRPATASLLVREFPGARVLPLEVTEYDLILSLHEAKRLGKKTGVIGSVEEMSRFDFDQVAAIMDMDFQVYWYSGSKEFLQKMEQARKDGVKVIVGGGTLGRIWCEQNGLINIGLHPGISPLLQTLRRAADIVQTRNWEKETFRFFQTIVDLSEDAITTLDENGIIVVFNMKASNIFRIPVTEVLNKPLEALPETLQKTFKELFYGSYSKMGDIRHVNGTMVLVKRVPYEVNGKQKGIVVTFQNVSQIQESEKHIRRELFAKGFVAKFTFDDIIHQSEAMNKVVARAAKYAQVDANVLIIGESGTGKELLAQSIHNAHPVRRSGPFVAHQLRRAAGFSPGKRTFRL